MPEREVYLLTGPVQTGKTTSLANWSEKRKNVYGILTPVVAGQRVFRNIHTAEQFPMIAGADEQEVLAVGRFVFSQKGFEKAIQILRGVLHKEGWLVVDEIGPLELRGEGFCGIVKEILATENKNQKILLVLREGLDDKAKNFFRINNAKTLRDISEL